MPHVRTQHPNASLTPRGRRKMVRLVIDRRLDDRSRSRQVPGRREDRHEVAQPVPRRRRGRSVRSVEPAEVVTERDACRVPTSDHRAAQAAPLGCCHIGHEVGRAGSTVQKILIAEGLGRLDSGDRATAEPIRRYQRDRPGELVHVDVKKLAGIPDGGGWRIHGRGQAPPVEAILDRLPVLAFGAR